MIAAARRLWTPAADLEVTLEANPTDAEADRFAAFADAGVEPPVAGPAVAGRRGARLPRPQPRRRRPRSGRRRRAARAFPRLSIDLIYARPGQTPAAWAEELHGRHRPRRRAHLALPADHRGRHRLRPRRAPGPVHARRTPRPARSCSTPPRRVLEAAGFDAYEVSNHARGEAARSRHNLIYWQGQDYVGAGPGAHGRITARTARGRRPTPRRGPPTTSPAWRETGVGFARPEALEPTRSGAGAAAERPADHSRACRWPTSPPWRSRPAADRRSGGASACWRDDPGRLRGHRRRAARPGPPDGRARDLAACQRRP